MGFGSVSKTVRRDNAGDRDLRSPPRINMNMRKLFSFLRRPRKGNPMTFVKVPYKNLLIQVAPDYYMDDGIRIPVDLRDAHRIADENDCMLPTTEMVDAIWQNADIRLPPRPLTPQNTGDSRFYNNIADPKWVKVHNDIVEQQLREAGANPGELIAGHKKDIVAHDVNSSRIAIYGWHRTSGRPIQPRSTVHGWNYKDYSQGLRLVSRIAFDKDGNTVRFTE